jgi:hypothetical protein
MAHRRVKRFGVAGVLKVDQVVGLERAHGKDLERSGRLAARQDETGEDEWA